MVAHVYLCPGIGLILSPELSWGLEIGKTRSSDDGNISLADAAFSAKHNLDISISRQTKKRWPTSPSRKLNSIRLSA